MSGSGMRFSLICFLLFFVVGCTHDIHPVVKDEGLYVTRINDASIQIVASQDFQRLVVKDVALKSSNWKGQKFNVAIGKPLTDGIYSYVGAAFSGTRIGDTPDADSAKATLMLSSADVVLWIDDDSSFISQMLFTPTYYINKVNAQAKVTLRGSLHLANGQTQTLVVSGTGLKSLIPAGMDAGVFEEVAGLASADIAKQIVALLRQANAENLKK
jgi:hypothetical protein